MLASIDNAFGHSTCWTVDEQLQHHPWSISIIDSRAFLSPEQHFTLTRDGARVLRLAFSVFSKFVNVLLSLSKKEIFFSRPWTRNNDRVELTPDSREFEPSCSGSQSLFCFLCLCRVHSAAMKLISALRCVSSRNKQISINEMTIWFELRPVHFECMLNVNP